MKSAYSKPYGQGNIYKNKENLQITTKENLPFEDEPSSESLPFASKMSSSIVLN